MGCVYMRPGGGGAKLYIGTMANSIIDEDTGKVTRSIRISQIGFVPNRAVIVAYPLSNKNYTDTETNDVIAFEWSSAEGVHNLAVLSSAGGVSLMPSTPAKKLITATLDDSNLLLGCMGFTHAYGTAMDEKEAAKAIEEAVDMGYTFFDTAECYLGNRADGTIARNEDLVGEALKPYRNRIKMATKCGVAHSPEGLVTDSRPETIRKSIEGSLKRLQTDHVDL